MIRIGHGYDVHKFADHRRLILCGVTIPYEKGLDGHSDADVAAHAVIDSLLGAAAMGDIGLLFPDTDQSYKNIDSMLLLAKTRELIDEKQYDIGNLDITIVAQKPKLAPYIGDMRKKIAQACGTKIENVSVKATTEEGLGFTGNLLGISATCVCLLKTSNGAN